MQNQSNYKEETEADVKNLATSMNDTSLDDYGSNTAAYATKETERFNSGSVGQAEHHSKHEERTNFSHVGYGNAIGAYEAYEDERDKNDNAAEVYENERDKDLNAIEAYEAYENERNENEFAEAYGDKSDNAIEAYETYENEKDEDDNDYYADIKYTESNKSPDVNSNHELKAKGPVDYDDDDEIGTYYDHKDFYSQT